MIVIAGSLYSSTSAEDRKLIDVVEERHRHRYEINPKYVAELETAGLKFVGHSIDNMRMEICELSGGCVQYCVEVGGGNMSVYNDYDL